MEDEQYAALTNYLENGVYPDGFSKGTPYEDPRKVTSWKQGSCIMLICSRMELCLIE